jgi:hypothetical protein
MSGYTVFDNKAKKFIAITRTNAEAIKIAKEKK